jgi:hypothetical protein
VGSYYLVKKLAVGVSPTAFLSKKNMNVTIIDFISQAGPTYSSLLKYTPFDP